jgi:hypothetical protein
MLFVVSHTYLRHEIFSAISIHFGVKCVGSMEGTSKKRSRSQKNGRMREGQMMKQIFFFFSHTNPMINLKFKRMKRGEKDDVACPIYQTGIRPFV